MGSIRNDFPIMFNTTAIPYPKTISEDTGVVETVKQTEAGTDIVNVSRYNKLKASLSYTCLQPTVQLLAGFSTVDSFTFKRYNPKINAYDEKIVRMRNFKYSLVEGSQDLTEVAGVWSVSFDLEEF
jgi:hypothetical protein